MKNISRNIKIIQEAFSIMSVASLQLTEAQSIDKPNVIFILSDDLGYTDIGCYGSKFYETPNIDRLALQGIRFTSAYASCPVSSPTRSSILTGKYTVNTGITDWIPGRQANEKLYCLPTERMKALPFKQQLDLNEITIAEVLQKNGYKTMISGKWHLGGDQQYGPEYQGFDIARCVKRGLGTPQYFLPYGLPDLDDGPAGEYLTDRQTDEAIKFIEANKNKPFFLYLSYYAPHSPLQGKKQHVYRFSKKADSLGLTLLPTFTTDRSWIKRTRKEDNCKERIIQSDPVNAALIYSMDENIGKLLSKIEELNLDKNTIIIFTSDNGGSSGTEQSATCNSPLRAGKGWLYEGGIRVPLIIKVPAIGRKHSEISIPASSIDFFNTIVELTGSDTERIENDGISLVNLLKTGKMKERPLFWHYPHYDWPGFEPGSAIRLGNLKLIDNFETGRQELYDLSDDISESNDISGINPQKVKRLYGMLKEWRNKTGAKMMDPNPNWNGLK
jgi:arylsulfatase A-like enzyme